MKHVLDSHTHTIVSGHAYSTLHEMARCYRTFFDNARYLP